MAILEVFLAIVIIYIVLSQVQINLPARYSDTANMDRLHRYSHDIAFSLCENLEMRRMMINDSMAFDLESYVPSDICCQVYLYKNSSNNHLLDSLVYTHSFYAENFTITERVIADLPAQADVVKIGDLNNDNSNDVVVSASDASCCSKSVRMYENRSGGWMETNITTILKADPYGLALGDSNNNGKRDATIGLFSADNETRMYENVSGRWVETNISSSVMNVYAVAVGDANNDGRNETIVGRFSGTNELRMYENKTGTWVETAIGDYSGSDVHSVEIGDANNDGKNEIVAGWDSEGAVRMYKNTSGGWVETNISDSGDWNFGNVMSVAIGDADNDGQNEVVMGMDWNTPRLRVYKNTTGRWVETNITGTDFIPYSVDIGDVDNDGQNEIVIGTDAGDNEIRMYTYRGGSWAEANISNVGTYCMSVDIGDADNDGSNELVAGFGSTTNEVRMYEISGSGRSYCDPPTSGISSSTSACLVGGGPNATNYSITSCSYGASSCSSFLLLSDSSSFSRQANENFTVGFSPIKNGSIIEFTLEGRQNGTGGVTYLYDTAGNQIASYGFANSSDETHVFYLTDFLPDANNKWNITVKPSVNASYDYAGLNVSTDVYAPRKIVVQTWNAGD